MSWPTIDLSGKRILVTGASSGMGAGIAEAVAQAGGDVAILGRDVARLGATAAKVRATGRTALQLVGDLAEDGVPAQLVAQTVDAFGGLDGLVNAAGVFLPIDIVTGGVVNLDRQWGANVRGPFGLAVAAVPHLRAAGGGSMVFISSIGGVVGFPGCTAYGATKGAIEILVKALAIEEAANGIRVNAIAPGHVRTPMNEHLFADPAYENAAIESTPMKRVGQVADIAPTAAFLLSSAASYITGQSICIDGGTVAA